MIASLKSPTTFLSAVSDHICGENVVYLMMIFVVKMWCFKHFISVLCNGQKVASLYMTQMMKIVVSLERKVTIYQKLIIITKTENSSRHNLHKN